MSTLFDLLPDEINQIISQRVKEQRAAQKIQNRVYKIFYKSYGFEWKEMIREKKSIIAGLEYYCYINGINDPWFDYSNHPLFACKANN